MVNHQMSIHLSMSGRFAVVHNGIIENYLSLKKKLIAKGFEFVSETDTEVIAHLFEYYYKGDIIETMTKVIENVEGSYALGILCSDYPDQFIAVRKASPMIIGLGDGENFIASDVTAILKYTRNIYYLEDNEIVVLTKDNVSVYNMDKEEIEKEVFTVNWDVSAAEKGGYAHFMMKEMEEQPKALRDTISPRIKDGKVVLDNISLTNEDIKGLRKIFIVACGSAYHVGVVGKYVIEKMCRIPVEVDYASEFRYRNPIINPDDIVIAVSQSGETADTLAAVELARRNGAFVYGICNAVGSSIARATNSGTYIHVGPEIGVASTKAFTGQVTVLLLLALTIGLEKGTVSEEKCRLITKELMMLPQTLESTLELVTSDVQSLSKIFTYAHNFIYMGRGVNYPTALEGALKLKEISYIHAEGYPAAEMKHGPIALIDAEMPCVVIATPDSTYDKTISNMEEIKARGGRIVAIVAEEDITVSQIADYVIKVPSVTEFLMPIIVSIPLQLLAYHIAVNKGRDVDKPRNLAKSVTVE